MLRGKQSEREAESAERREHEHISKRSHPRILPVTWPFFILSSRNSGESLVCALNSDKRDAAQQSGGVLERADAHTVDT